jgi:hypothetical protein
MTVADILSGTKARKLGEIIVTDDMRKKLDAQRIGDMTIEKLTADVVKYGNGGRMPFHTQWVWQATGLLKAHPEECWKLVDVFNSPDLIVDGRPASTRHLWKPMRNAAAT